MNFLDQLNDSQREAVTYTEGASLIVAGAGSGKTRVLTYRIAYLLQQGVPAGRIMALTFTNKAAREMKERIMRLVDARDARYLVMGTFHSVCTRLLRPYAEQLGYTRDFSIYDTPDMKSVIKGICKERGLDEKVYKPGAVQSRISMAKNGGIGPREYGMNQQLLREDREARMYEFATVYELYQIRLKAANAMDFDDLLINMLRLLEVCPEAREKYRQQFQYILVDEYQDTNYIQFQLVKKLAEPQNNICVVGDDAQSIYSFRGADIRNILNFRQVYPNARLFKLERNYRSTQTIVNAANSLIHKNVHQIEKTVYSEKEEGAPLNLQPYMDDKTEALGVAMKIQRMKHKGYDSFAVLYRTNAQSRVIEGELRKLNIPYRIYGGTSFYQRKEIKDALGYLRLAVNARDNEALLRIVGFPGRGIGETTMKKVSANATEHHRCYLDVMREPDETGLDVSAATKKKLQAFALLIDGYHEQSEAMDAFRFAEMVMRTSGVMTALALDRTAEGIDRAQNVQELLNAIHEFVEGRQNEGIDFTPVTDFLSEVSLLTDQDENLTDTTERVTLMTVHAAKGLEFPVVFIVGMEENLFPSQFAVRPQDIEEERRLLYVAITRAMEQCYVSFARQRFRNGSFSFNSPSRFLNDIDKRYFEMTRAASEGGKVTAPTRPTRPTNPANPVITTGRTMPTNPARPVSGATSEIASSVWKAGDRVAHRVFGEGTVTRIYRDEVTENDKIEINFDTQGTKTLLLTHAKLERTT
ncbi:MAG: UvrD-helicase domain-containing protein [Paludibacteraceae bacterium]|nr:UvrD-helicase domain-containing protein [Paludibacteraceae bacterium]MBQ8704782.1 UvrD-helicase domain-containing protein [Paludibacteraceae bacterium]